MTSKSPGSLQRLWRVAIRGPQGLEQCIGAIVCGHFPDLTAPTETGFTAIVSTARLGTQSPLIDSGGCRFVVAPISHQTSSNRCRFDNLPAAFAWLDAAKADLLDAGWLELGLDPIADPD